MLAPKAEGQGSRGPPRSRVTYPCDAEGLREVTRKALYGLLLLSH